MSNLREGAYGAYYGSYFDESAYLTQSQMEINALYIYSWCADHGWSINAAAALLGNMQAESTLNPGCWQSHQIGNMSGGYGLTQWTPASKYIDWVTGDASEIDNQLARIQYEIDYGGQWYSTDAYPLTFKEFTVSTESVSYLASAFLKNYERAGVEVEEKRQANAAAWYEYITGEEPSEPNPTPQPNARKKKYNFLLFNRRRMRL